MALLHGAAPPGLKCSSMLLAAVALVSQGSCLEQAAYHASEHTALSSDHGLGHREVAAAATDAVNAAPPPTPPGAVASCTTALIQGARISDWGQVITHDYEPACKGSWAQVVLRFRGAVNAGIQFDRYGSFFLGGIELLRLTTPEPEYGRGIAWNVDKDMSGYLDLFERKGKAVLYIPNIVNQEYTGVISVNVTLDFYAELPIRSPRGPTGFSQELSAAGVGSQDRLETQPLLGHEATGKIPDAVCGNSDNGMKQVWTQNMTLSSRSVSRLWLDVKASGHGCEEFWYSNRPTGQAEAEECNGGAHRELFVRLDGHLAGAALPFPIVYTGGDNPVLWKPIVGVDTLDIPAHRFDISPFIGLLSDGKNHSISVGVQENDEGSGFWCISAALIMAIDQTIENKAGRHPDIVGDASDTDFFTEMQNTTDANELVTVGHRRFTVKGNVAHTGGGMTSHLVETYLYSFFAQGKGSNLVAMLKQQFQSITKPHGGVKLATVASTIFDFSRQLDEGGKARLNTSGSLEKPRTMLEIKQVRSNHRLFRIGSSPESYAAWRETVDSKADLDQNRPENAHATFEVEDSTSGGPCFLSRVEGEDSFISVSEHLERPCGWPVGGATFCPDASCVGFGLEGLPPRLAPGARLWAAPKPPGKLRPLLPHLKNITTFLRKGMPQNRQSQKEISDCDEASLPRPRGGNPLHVVS